LTSLNNASAQTVNNSAFDEIELSGTTSITVGSTTTITVTIKKSSAVTPVTFETKFNLVTGDQAATGVFKQNGLIVSQLTILAGTASASFTYTNTKVGTGTHVLTLTRAEGDAPATTENGTKSLTITVSPGSVSKVLLTSPESGPIAGVASGNFVLTLADVYDNPKNASSTTSFTLTTNVGTGTHTFTPVSPITITSGTASTSFTFSSTKSGLHTITALRGGGDGPSGMTASRAITINPGTASATQSVLSPISSTLTANGSATQQFTVQARDAYGNNLTTGGTSTVTITLSSGTGSIDSTTDLNNSIYAATLTAPTAIGTATITATLDGAPVNNGGATQATSSITYVAGSVSSTTSTVNITAGPIAADNIATATITVTLKDANNNVVQGKTVTINQGTGSSTISPSSATTNASGEALFTVKSTKAETVTYTATGDGVPLTQTVTMTFNPGAISVGAIGSQLSGTNLSRLADGTQAATISIQLKDQYGNNLTTNGVAVTFSSTLGSFSTTSTPTTTSGVASTTLVSNIAGTASVTATLDHDNNPATDQQALSNGSPVLVTYGNNTVTKLLLLLPGETSAPGTLTGKAGTPISHAAGVPFTVDVRAVDANWNLVTSSNPTVSFSSGDATAILPNSLALSGGTGLFSVNLLKVGNQTITVTAASLTLTSATATVTITAGIPIVTTGTSTNVLSTTAIIQNNEVTSQGGNTVTERGVCYATSSNPTTPCVQTGSGVGTYSATLSSLSSATTYYVRAYAKNSLGTAYGSNVTFTTASPESAPVVSTQSVTLITQTTAQGNGSVTSSTAVTARGICYATTSLPTLSNTCVAAGSGVGTFTATLSSLSPTTLYYVRAYATNGAGTSYGNQETFTTLMGTTTPTVSTATVTLITSTSATVGGTITSDGNSALTARGVCYATTANPSVGVNSCSIASGTSTGTFTIGLTGLTANTTYHVRAYATNSLGTSYGGNVTFSTASGAAAKLVLTNNPIAGTSGAPLNPQPRLEIRDAQDNLVTSSTAQVSAQVTSGADGVISGEGVRSADGGVVLFQNMGLSGNQNVTYTITFSSGTLQVATMTATLAAPLNPPTVSTASVTIYTSNTATLGGNVTSLGSSALSARGICYSSTNTSPALSLSNSTCVVASGTTTGTFTVAATGLTLSTTYYVRAYATNTQGTAYGSSVSFTTTALENPVPVVTSITPDAAAPGQTVNVTIIGANFATGATVKVEGSGITVNNVSRVSSTTISAQFVMASNATTGSRLIKVTNPSPGGGESTTSAVFNVALPAPSPNSSKWPTGSLVSTSSTPTFDWNAVTGAVNYDLQVSNQPNFIQSLTCESTCDETQANNLFLSFSTTATTFTVPTPLPVGFQYYWRIRANTSTIKGVWSNAISFQVIAPPSPPALISPSNGATGVTGPVAFQWTPTNSTLSYHIQISTSVTFTTIYNEGTGLTSVAYTLPEFTSGNPVQYFWRVRSIGIGGTGEWSSVSFFNRAKLTSDADEGAEIPSTYSLEQNYPNPFNPSTNIRFGLPETAPVTLEVYNLQGQKVAVLLQNVTKSAGMHTLSFDASKLSSGIYVYRIMAGSTFMASQKMVLLK
jgi:hypothetical protein